MTDHARARVSNEESSSTPRSSAEVALPSHKGARGLQDELKERWSHSDEQPEHDQRPDGAKPMQTGVIVRRSLRVIAGLAIVAVFGWMPLRAVWQSSSVEAIVNSRLVTLRSPIDGRVSSLLDLSRQMGPVREGELVARIVNPRGDRMRLDDLRRQLARLENQRPTLSAKLATADSARQDLARQAAQFRDGRILQLEARTAELRTSIEAAATRLEEATAAVERASTLARSGAVSTVELARLTREQSVAQQAELAARIRLEGATVELAAARRGTYLGDSYNDRPSSVQREEEMRQRAEDLKADLMQVDAEIDWLAREMITERTRFVERSESNITLPAAGQIWEVMTSPGEDVRAGQPLLKVLDCTQALITANVTERVYNELQLGDHATFEPSDGGPGIDGTVTNLTGASGAPANLAINPDVLSKEPYRVTVTLPPVNVAASGCTVGRTGRVVFSGTKS
ncbi:HlyD family efflux transporter periplasmic adaptor subunit [Bradyrhizobium jicamae]|uniref:HlyD family efflux transporter periplasmic adaptor subunit n=1 Tax=Bradyrhizobium jicamae TaxID=280332 RepID=A0ABS5FWX1_9BRAD|nr:HlyD family efflux transporter periplasmic adaptor subunit [Bradyrhizobium jicamae]MBR0801320.1 HlyD family efflux transporter periplasmic adaptor subunit [Bradyrhizobium jicamae]